jgi:hypothetical protein
MSEIEERVRRWSFELDGILKAMGDMDELPLESILDMVRYTRFQLKELIRRLNGRFRESD